jgi:hypothetical protein
MRNLSVLLRAADSGALADQSVNFQQTLRRNGQVFTINYQRGTFAQFFVNNVNCCADHFEKALRKLGFNVEVSEDPETTTKREPCHDCQMPAT